MPCSNREIDLLRGLLSNLRWAARFVSVLLLIAHTHRHTHTHAHKTRSTRPHVEKKTGVNLHWFHLQLKTLVTNTSKIIIQRIPPHPSNVSQKCITSYLRTHVQLLYHTNDTVHQAQLHYSARFPTACHMLRTPPLSPPCANPARSTVVVGLRGEVNASTALVGRRSMRSSVAKLCPFLPWGVLSPVLAGMGGALLMAAPVPPEAHFGAAALEGGLR